MTNSLKLKAAIVGSGFARTNIALKMGISLYSLHKKINNITEFKASEIDTLSKLLNLDVRAKEDIFFAKM